MSSLLGGVIGGAIVVYTSTRLKEKNGCAYVIDKLNKFSNSLRPAAVRVAKEGLVVKERIRSDLGTVREELEGIMEEARKADQEKGVKAASRKEEQIRSQLMSDLEALKEELDDIMEGVRKTPEAEKKRKAARRKEEPVPGEKEKATVKERIRSDLGTVREELKEIMKDAREVQKEESAKAARPDSIDERLKEVDMHLKTLDKKTKKKPIKRKPSKKPGAAQETKKKPIKRKPSKKLGAAR